MQQHRRSFRRRVEIAFALCVFWLSLMWGFAFYAGIRLSEDRVLMNQLQRAAEKYPDLALGLRGYDDVGSLPESLQEWAETSPDPGLYEFVDEELHVAVVSAKNEGGRAFVVFDVAGIEAASSEDWWLLLVISSVVIILGALGFSVGVLVMRRAVNPVVQLSRAVANVDLENLSAGDRKIIDCTRFENDEIGALAEIISKTFERMSEFIARERYFTGWASHELRTPITVIMGALELLEESELSIGDVQALDRARRATIEMRSTVEMFLCLARETSEGSGEDFLVSPLVRWAVDQQQHLLNGKFIDVDIANLAESKVYGNPQAFLTAVNNLVRNAFEQTFSGQGPIEIIINHGELLIKNNLNDAAGEKAEIIGPSFHGYGLGLGIVQKLCERNDWSFSLEVNERRVTACLSWITAHGGASEQ